MKRENENDNGLKMPANKKMGLTSVEDFIAEDFGAEGTPERLEFEAGADAFILGEKLKEERKKAGLTQEQFCH